MDKEESASSSWTVYGGMDWGKDDGAAVLITETVEGNQTRLLLEAPPGKKIRVTSMIINGQDIPCTDFKLQPFQQRLMRHLYKENSSLIAEASGLSPELLTSPLRGGREERAGGVYGRNNIREITALWKLKEDILAMEDKVVAPSALKLLLEIWANSPPADLSIMSNPSNTPNSDHIYPGGGYFNSTRLPASITCPQCGRVSRHPGDIAHAWCPMCREYHADMKPRPKLPEGWTSKWYPAYFAGSLETVTDRLEVRCPWGCCRFGSAMMVGRLTLRAMDMDAARRDVENKLWIYILQRLANGSHTCRHAEQIRRRHHQESESILRWRSEGLMPYNKHLGATLVWKHVRMVREYHRPQNVYFREVINAIDPDPAKGPVFTGNLDAPYQLGVPFNFAEGMACAGPVGALKGYLNGDDDPYVMAVWCTVIDDVSGNWSPIIPTNNSGVFMCRAGIPAAIYRVTRDQERSGEYDMRLVLGEDVLSLIQQDEDAPLDTERGVSTAQVPSDFKRPAPPQPQQYFDETANWPWPPAAMAIDLLSDIAQCVSPTVHIQWTPKTSGRRGQLPRHGKHHTKRRY
jgi:hypothetical protein